MNPWWASLLLGVTITGAPRAGAVTDARTLGQLCTREFDLSQFQPSAGPVVVESGPHSPDEPVVYELTIHNDSDTTIHFLGAETSCGCTTVALPADGISPGTSGYLRLNVTIEDATGASSVLALCHVEDSEGLRRVLSFQITTRIDDSMSLSPSVITLLRDLRNPPGEAVHRSEPVVVRVTPEILDTNAALITIRPWGEFPEGIRIDQAVDHQVLPGDTFCVDIASSAVSSGPETTAIPLLLTVYSDRGAELATAERVLRVRCVADVLARTEPGDVYLGLIRQEELPVWREFTIQLEPAMEFIVEIGDAPPGLHIDLLEHGDQVPRETQAARVMLTDAPLVGGGLLEVPLRLAGTDATGGEWTHHFSIPVQWFRVR